MPEPDLAQRLEHALSSRYRILRDLGAGGMAVVFLAEDLRHGRQVALKVIRPELTEAVGATRFHREIQITAGLTHPNIPPLLDSGEAQGLLYYAMPYVEGDTLSRRIEKEGRLGIAESLSLARELSDALAYAHRQGVIHRDVKPSNVFLEEGHALLGDFGVALIGDAAGENITSTEMVLGTVEYMSPEQCSGSHKVDPRSDVYSMGCLLYEMLAGEPPFVGRTRAAVVARQLGDPPPSLEVMRGDVPKEVAVVVERCLAKAPSDRYATAAHLRDDLESVLQAVQGGRITRSGASASRRRWVWAAPALVLAALLGVLAWPGTAPAVNANRVVVFPLAERGGGAEAGADAALMVGNALVQTEPLRWIDGWSRMTPEERGDPALLTDVQARAITLDRGARSFVTGGVARSGDTLSVRLVLNDAVGDSILAQASVSGHVDETSPERLAVQAVVQILPALLDPGRMVDLTHITDREPAAVALWIQGDRAYRLGRFESAYDLYRRAVESDSLLVFAALKGGQAASWDERPAEAADLLGLAVRHDTLLPPAQREFARGLLAYEAGESDEAVARFRGALALEPDWAEAWTALGEVYQHLFPKDVIVGTSAREAFASAERLDSLFLPPLVHLTEYELLDGNVSAGRVLLERLQRAEAGSHAMGWLTLMEACVAAENPRLSIPQASTNRLIWASHEFAAGMANQSCAEIGFRDVLGREDLDRAQHWAAVIGLMGVLVAQGRDEAADSLLDESLAWGEGSTRFLYAFAVAAGADLVRGARAVDAEADGLWGPGYDRVGPTTLAVLALWNALEGDVPTARRQVQRLVEEATAGTQLAGILAPAARAHLLVAEGDSAGALAVLEALDPTFPRTKLDLGGLVEPLAPERLLKAELLLAAGAYQDAYRAAALFDHPGAAMFVAFVPRSLVVRMRAAEALRGRDWAERAEMARARLVALGRQDLLASARK